METFDAVILHVTVQGFTQTIYSFSFLGELEKETSLMQKRMLALEPRIDVISSEIQVWFRIRKMTKNIYLLEN